MSNKNNNQLATINGGNAISVLSSAISGIADSLGYKPTYVEVDEDGKSLVPIYDSENKCIIESREELPADVRDAVNEINALGSLSDISGVYLAKAVYQLAEYAENNGFSSVGKFVSEMIPRIKANYANQLYNVAKSFLDIAEDGTPSWKYDFCKGCSVSNLALIMPLVNKSESVEDFIADYIDSGKIHPRKVQSKLKEELSALSSKDSKGKDSKGKDSKGKDSEGNGNTASLESAWAMVRTAVLEGKWDTDEFMAVLTDSIRVLDTAVELVARGDENK